MAGWDWEPLTTGQLEVVTLPTFCDVAAQRRNYDPGNDDPNDLRWSYWVGVDGTIWRCFIAGGVLPTSTSDYPWQEVPGPNAGKVVRVAVSPSLSVWCVTDQHTAWFLPKGLRTGTWVRANLPANTQPVDVDVARDESVWVLMADGTYWVQRSDGQTRYFTPALPLQGLAGFDEPQASDGSWGGAWGIYKSATGGGGQIGFCSGHWTSGGNFINDVVDISTSPEYLWLVTSDGNVWTTQDGTSKTLMIMEASRICGSNEQPPGGEIAYAVAKNGTPWGYFPQPSL
jgi:hypothetical protein